MTEQNIKRILMAAASPGDIDRLRVDKEHRIISEVLLDSSGRNNFKIKLLSAVQGADFQRELLEYKPHIVHFSGHAEKDRVAFDGNGKKAQWVDSEAVAGLLASAASHVECVVFNACWTDDLAESVGQSIDYVIGMAESVYDKTSIEFSRGFYTALFAGAFYPKAFEHGRLAVQMKGLPDFQIPKLKIRDKAHRVPFIPDHDTDILILCHSEQKSWAKDIQTRLDDLMASRLGHRNTFTLKLLSDTDEHMPEAASKAGVILPVSSTAFMDSEICKQALDDFIQAVNDPTRIFLMEIYAAARPPALLQVLSYRFWKADSELFTAADAHFHTRLDMLADEVVDRLKRLKSESEHQKQMQEQLKRHPAPQADLPRALLFVNAAPEDRELLEQVVGFLDENDAEYIQPVTAASDPSPAEVRRDLENNLDTCDLYMVIYGRSSVIWVREQILFSRRVWRRRKQDLKVVLVHNKTGNGPKDPINLKLDNLRVYDCPPGEIRNYLPICMEEVCYD